jgi:AraC family transcriptional regulator of adaptative response/methylated-DNA-[protein]-cysteine methyltransferase
VYSSGFNSSARFYATSNQVLGMTPTALRRGGASVPIHFAIGQSTLGSVLVAQSPRGICAISLGDDPEQLVHDLEKRFPRAVLTAGDESFNQVVAMVVGLIETPGTDLGLPLDIRGTAFQQRVWQALTALPAGSTVTYQNLANILEMPRAVRAVAQACAANGIAVAIPCHRVIRTDGGVSGYRWGVERKKLLLEREAKSSKRADL